MHHAGRLVFSPGRSGDPCPCFPFNDPAEARGLAGPRLAFGGLVADVQSSLAGSLCSKIALSGASLSFGSGAWCWLDENYRVIAALGVIIGAVVGITGLVLQYMVQRRRHAIAVAEHHAVMTRLRGGVDGSGRIWP